VKVSFGILLIISCSVFWYLNNFNKNLRMKLKKEQNSFVRFFLYLEKKMRMVEISDDK
jgi:hypothetical protein